MDTTIFTIIKRPVETVQRRALTLFTIRDASKHAAQKGAHVAAAPAAARQVPTEKKENELQKKYLKASKEPKLMSVL